MDIMTGPIEVIQCTMQGLYLKHDISFESRRKFEMKMLFSPLLCLCQVDLKGEVEV